MADNESSGKQCSGAREYHLRPVSHSDAEALATLGRESFCAAFSELYSDDDLRAFLKQVYDRAVVESEIADPAFIHCLVDLDGKLLGYCKLQQPSGYSDNTKAKNPIALNQIYTAPGMTGQGVGAALMEWAISEARSRECDAIQLSVWSGNVAAQKFYRRYGFEKTADIYFWVGSQRDDEFLFELKLGGQKGDLG